MTDQQNTTPPPDHKAVRYPKCTNCNHSIVSHYKQSQVKTQHLPPVLVGSCKIPFCKCDPGYEGEGQDGLYEND